MGVTKTLPPMGSMDVAVAHVTEAFKANGFGLPPGTTNLDFASVFSSKGVDDSFRPFRLLGFCNPKIAHEALRTNVYASMLMPCNVSVLQEEDGSFKVIAFDPHTLLGSGIDDGDAAALRDLSTAIHDKIAAAMAAL